MASGSHAKLTDRELAEAASRLGLDEANGTQPTEREQLAADVCLLEELIAHVTKQTDRAERRLERLERCLADRRGMPNGSRELRLRAECVAIKSELARLGLATSLAEQFARLRGAEALRLREGAQPREERSIGRAS